VENTLIYKQVDIERQQRRVIKSESIISAHDLPRWKFKVSRGKSQYGHCRISDKTIAVSKYILMYAKEEVFMKILKHEIAHAKAWETYRSTGHNAVFRMIARELGAYEKSYVPSNEEISYYGNFSHKYTLSCPKCKTERIVRKVRKGRIVCPDCFQKEKVFIDLNVKRNF
jgi:predicted SprT family Zn-dependent metalloprotease